MDDTPTKQRARTELLAWGLAYLLGEQQGREDRRHAMGPRTIAWAEGMVAEAIACLPDEPVRASLRADHPLRQRIANVLLAAYTAALETPRGGS